MPISKLISGGQTGADRGGLNAALSAKSQTPIIQNGPASLFVSDPFKVSVFKTLKI